MRTLVVGAGGVGGFFGGLLMRAGADVTFLAHGENLRALQRGGLEVQSRTLGTFRGAVKAVDRGEDLPPFDLILICVKAHHSNDVITLIEPAVGAQTTIVSLQNGLHAERAFARHFGADKILGGFCYLGSSLVAPGVVKHVASGRIVLGEFDGRLSSRLQAVEQYLSSARIEVETTREIRARLWKKLIWNVGFNGPTALVDLNVGEILKRPEQRMFMMALMREAVAVGRAAGAAVDDNLPEKILSPLPGDPTSNMEFVEPSMLHDRRAGRAMEWDIFYGEIAREGRRLGVATPMCDLVGGLLKALDPRPRIS